MFAWIMTTVAVISLFTAAWIERRAAKPWSESTRLAMMFVAMMAGGAFVAVLSHIGR